MKQTQATDVHLGIQTGRGTLVIEKGYTHPQAVASLGVSLSALRRWVRAERGGGGADSGQKAITISLAINGSR